MQFSDLDRNTVSYFLRLPDGSLAGGGYDSTGFQSLTRLETGQVTSITAVDNSATYNGWSDLVSTNSALIRLELGTCTGRSANFADPDSTRNPGDHPDHIATANLADSLDTAGQQTKVATFGRVYAGLNEYGWPGPCDSIHRAWLSRSYHRVEAAPFPAACSVFARSSCVPAQLNPPRFSRNPEQCHSLCSPRTVAPASQQPASLWGTVLKKNLSPPI